MLDVVFMAMFAIVIVMLFSIYKVRTGRRFASHRKIQLSLTIVLVVAVSAFEIDMRFFTKWRELAAESPYYESGLVSKMLAFHLLFAIPTPLIWGYTILGAVRHFSKDDPKPNDFSEKHRLWGRIAAAAMFMTATTGCVFYWMAFIA